MGPHFAGGDAGKCDDEMRPRGEERHPWVSRGAATTLGYWGQFSRGPFDTLARAGHCPPQAARWASPPIPPPLVGVVPEAGTPVHSACPTGQPLAARDILGWQMPLLSEAACTWALEMATVPSAEEVAFSTRDSCVLPRPRRGRRQPRQPWLGCFLSQSLGRQSSTPLARQAGRAAATEGSSSSGSDSRALGRRSRCGLHTWRAPSGLSVPVSLSPCHQKWERNGSTEASVAGWVE